jgi:hypothetical protein
VVFDGRLSCPLPPLFSFAIYFTHPDVTPNTVRPVELLEAIKRKTPLDVWCSIRAEIFFVRLLASNFDADDECIAHFRKEKAVRGDYTRQIQALKVSAVNHDAEYQQQSGASVDQSNEFRQLPGSVPSYIDVPVVDYYHGLLYSYVGADWQTDNGQLFVGMAMFYISNAKAKNQTNGPWQEAIALGWMSW